MQAAMSSLADVLCLMALFTAVSSDIVIPDTVSYRTADLVFYKEKATWYQATRLCHARGGRLAMLDDSTMLWRFYKIRKTAGGDWEDVFISMAQNGAENVFYDHETCQEVDLTAWEFKHENDLSFDTDKKCVLARHEDYMWEIKKCDDELRYVCQYPGAPCVFQTAASVSLLTLPMLNSSQATCTAQCQLMDGCFATAPSGDVTVPPFTRCLFVVVGDSTNPMTALTCPEGQYFKNVSESAKDLFPNTNDPTVDPGNCSPNTTPGGSTGQQPLSDILNAASAQYAGSCSPSIRISPTTVMETMVVTQPPVLTTVFVSLTPEVVTEYFTATPEIHVQTSYVTVTPAVVTVTVTPSPVVETVTLVSGDVQPAYVTVTAPAPTAYVTATDYVTTTVMATATTTAEVIVTSTICPSPSTMVVADCSSSATTTTTTTTPNPTVVNASKSTDQVRKEMSSVVKELTVNPQSVSKTRRKKESAPDSRPSAQTIGYVAILLLVVPPLVILIIDLPALFRHLCCSRGRQAPCAAKTAASSHAGGGGGGGESCI